MESTIKRDKNGNIIYMKIVKIQMELSTSICSTSLES